MSARILIVEDNEMNRDLLSRFLQLYGYLPVQAVDGGHAMELIRTEPPDLVLMDVSLPGEDGCQITRRLKQDDATRQLPVIALTAHAMIGDRERCLEAGCDDYETKPIDFPRLMEKIDSLLLRRVVL